MQHPPILPTTRSGLVRQAPGIAAAPGIIVEGENGTEPLSETTQGLAQQILKYLKPIL